jgi:hypothetical protein
VQTIDAGFEGSLFSPERNFTVEKLLSSENLFIEQDYLIYPNPVSDILNINLSENKVKSIKIFNIYGELIFQKTSLNSIENVHVESWPSGIYLIKIFSEKGYYIKKIVKE